MKKALALILSAAAVLCLFASCGTDEEENETTETVETSAVTEAATNDVTVATSEDTNSEVGYPYMNINDEAYVVSASDGFDNAGFTTLICDSDDTYTFTAVGSDTTWDIYVLDGEFDDQIRLLPQAYTPSLSGNGSLEIKNGQYVYIYCSNNAFTSDLSNNDTLKITRAGAAANEDNGNAAAIAEGNYGDANYGRVSATVTKSGDNYLVDITWSNTAADGYEWTMTCTLDGNKLSYTDCKKVEYSYADENSDPTYTTLSDNGTGYFTVENGTLAWDGAADADCQAIVFAQ